MRPYFVVERELSGRATIDTLVVSVLNELKKGSVDVSTIALLIQEIQDIHNEYKTVFKAITVTVQKNESAKVDYPVTLNEIKKLLELRLNCFNCDSDFISLQYDEICDNCKMILSDA